MSIRLSIGVQRIQRNSLYFHPSNTSPWVRLPHHLDVAQDTWLLSSLRQGHIPKMRNSIRQKINTTSMHTYSWHCIIATVQVWYPEVLEFGNGCISRVFRCPITLKLGVRSLPDISDQYPRDCSLLSQYYSVTISCCWSRCLPLQRLLILAAPLRDVPHDNFGFLSFELMEGDWTFAFLTKLLLQVPRHTG